MHDDKLFNILIAWFRYSTIFGLAFCVICAFFLSFDPFRGLEMMVMTDLYGNIEMPSAARPAYNFVFLLFCLASVMAFVMQLYVVHYGLARRERWAFQVIVIGIVTWLSGGTAIVWYCEAWSYFVSVGMMFLMYVPALFLLKRYF